MIVSFHEIADGDERYLRELKTGCTVALLEAIIIHLRRGQWEIVTLDSALARLEDLGASARCAVLTFDDAYRDTLSDALPVLERFQAPFTVYVPTGAITRDLHAWWLGLRALVQSRDRFSVAAMGKAILCDDIGAKLSGYATVRDWVHQDLARATLLDDTFKSYGISLRDLNSRYFMTAGDVCSLARHPLATIGAHSTSHAPLSTLDKEAARSDLADNRSYLERLLGRPVDHLAYPYGDARACGEREYALAQAIGFRSAVTTSQGPLFPHHREALYRLPRLGIAGTVTHLDYIRTSIREYEHADARSFQ